MADAKCDLDYSFASLRNQLTKAPNQLADQLLVSAAEFLAVKLLKVGEENGRTSQRVQCGCSAGDTW